MVVVMSEPGWPTRTSLLEALVCRTAPVSVSDSLKVIHLFFLSFYFAKAEHAVKDE